MKITPKDVPIKAFLIDFNRTEGRHLSKEEMSCFVREMKIMFRGGRQGDKRCKGQDKS